MKTYKELFEIKINRKTIAGNTGATLPEFDSEFKNKKLKKKINLETEKFWLDFDKGSLVSNLKGGIFIKMKNRKEEPDYADATWGVGIKRSKENMEKIIKAL